MRNVFKMSVVIFLSFAVTSCAGLTKRDTNRWLNSKKGDPKLNLTGRWNSGGISSGGWGDGNFIQEGSRISGTLGMYYVDGVVTGEKVYMAISSGNKIYYTALLKRSADGSIAGKAVERVIIDSPGAENAASYLILLKKYSK